MILLTAVNIINILLQFNSALIHVIQFSSVQLYLTICNPMECSMPGLPVYHQFPEFTQTYIH